MTNYGDVEQYFSGRVLIGEDFSAEDIAQWFADEKEATSRIRGAEWEYAYHAMNWFHGYRKLPKEKFSSALSFGGGDGSELLPILDRLENITVLEPSEDVKPAISARYIAPCADGSLPFTESTFELITCLSVLHHVPNVSSIIKEFYRCTTRGGFVLLTEPIISMGDWRRPRLGLSKHERGIPLHLLRSFIENAGFRVMSETKCCFAPLMYVNRKLHTRAYNSRLVVLLDHLLSSLPIWPAKYHAESSLDKFRPMGVFYLLTK